EKFPRRPQGYHRDVRERLTQLLSEIISGADTDTNIRHSADGLDRGELFAAMIRHDDPEPDLQVGLDQPDLAKQLRITRNRCHGDINLVLRELGGECLERHGKELQSNSEFPCQKVSHFYIQSDQVARAAEIGKG